MTTDETLRMLNATCPVTGGRCLPEWHWCQSRQDPKSGRIVECNPTRHLDVPDTRTYRIDSPKGPVIVTGEYPTETT